MFLLALLAAVQGLTGAPENADTLWIGMQEKSRALTVRIDQAKRDGTPPPLLTNPADFDAVYAAMDRTAVWYISGKAPNDPTGQSCAQLRKLIGAYQGFPATQTANEVALASAADSVCTINLAGARMRALGEAAPAGREGEWRAAHQALQGEMITAWRGYLERLAAPGVRPQVREALVSGLLVDRAFFAASLTADDQAKMRTAVHQAKQKIKLEADDRAYTALEPRLIALETGFFGKYCNQICKASAP